MKLFNFWLKTLLSKFGVIIRKKNQSWSFVPFVSTPEGFNQELLNKYEIDLILDVGASTGYWAGNLRKNHYKGRIISFEPQDSAYKKIAARAKSDLNWDVVKVALGDKDEEADFHLSKYSESSSLSEMLKSHQDAFPESHFTNEKIQVKVQKLDTLLPSIQRKEVNIFAKIDAQGFEQKILFGASKSLNKIKMLQLEMSFKKLYTDDVLFQEMYQYMYDLGFCLIHISPGFKNEKTSELLQVDAIFLRNN